MAATTATLANSPLKPLYLDCLHEVKYWSWPPDTKVSYALLFSCSRREQKSVPDEYLKIMDARLRTVFDNAVRGESRKDILPSADTKHCANLRDHLWECRCNNLDRKGFPIRQKFEEEVIKRILKSPKIANALRTKTAFELNLTFFDSNGLLGEQILLFRLFDEMKKRNLQGTITLYFIDEKYTEPVSCDTPDEMLTQFIREICIVAPPGIKIISAFFKDLQEYKATASSGELFKHDLVFCADFDGKDSTLDYFFQASRGPSALPIVVMQKAKGKLDSEVCVMDRPRKKQEDSERSSRSASTPFLVGGAVALVAVALFVVLSRSQSKK